MGFNRIKNFVWDGPRTTSQPYFHTWEAFQGKAYPNYPTGHEAEHQARADRDRERWIKKRDGIDQRERDRIERHLRKRRREKTGRNTPARRR